MSFWDEEIDELINEIDALGEKISNDDVRIIIARSDCSVLDERFIRYLKQKEIKLDVYLLDKILEKEPFTVDLDIELRRKIDSEDGMLKDKRIALLEEVGAISYTIEENNPLFSDFMLERFDVHDIVSMYKHGYLLENSNNSDYMDYYELLNEENREAFVHIYKEIVSKEDKEFDPVKFTSVAKKYMKNPKLFNEIVGNLENEDLSAHLKQFFLSDYRNLQVDSIDDIRNIDKTLLDKYKTEWGSTSYKVIQLLTGSTSNMLFMDKLSDKKFSDIAECLDDNVDERLLETLGNIQLLKRLHSKINLNKKVGQEFAEALLDELSLEDRNFLIDSFRSAKANLTGVYERELQDSLFSLDDIEKKAEDGIVSNVELKEIEVDGEPIKYIVVKSPAILIQHVMNAYNKAHDKGSLDLFTNKQDIVSVPVFSTSVITNESSYILEKSKSIGAYSKHKINSEDDVVVLFDSVPDGALALFGPSDCSVETSKNNLESITCFSAGDPTTYAPVKDILRMTEEGGENGTEYLFFMDKLLKPAGIRVYGDEPSIYEVRAAKKLGVPIVKLEQAVEKSEQKRSVKEINPNSRVKEIMERIEKVLDRFVDKNITVSQIGRRSRDYEEEMDFFEDYVWPEDEFGDEFGE